MGKPEPWASHGRNADTVGELGNPSPWLAAAIFEAEAERSARRAERDREEKKADQAEAHEAVLVRSGMEWAAANQRPWDPANPYQHIPSLETQMAMIENAEARQLWQKARRALMDVGLSASDATQMLRSRLPEVRDDLPVAPQPSPEEVAEAAADAQLEAARSRSEIAGRRAKIRRVLSRSGR